MSSNPITIIPEPVTSCEGCEGACCRVIKISVQHMTEDQLRWAGMRGEIKDGVWHIRSECVNLQPDGKCGIYETRPGVCRDFKVGGNHCLDAREAYAKRKECEQ